MKLIRKYFRAFTLGMENSFEYRANFLLSMVSAIFPILIQYFLWTSVFSSTSSKYVYGYTYSQMIIYSILAGVVSKLVSAGFEWEVNDDIKNGGLNKFIIKPIGYFQYRVSCFLGQKSVHLLVMSIITAVILAVMSKTLGFSMETSRILMFAASIILAILLNFLIVFCISTSAFWLNEAWGVFIISNLLVNIISGGIFPLDIFGDRILRVFDLLPFKYTIFFPVNIINGKLSIELVLQGMLIQCTWILLLSAAANLLWKAGSKKYVAVGG